MKKSMLALFGVLMSAVLCAMSIAEEASPQTKDKIICDKEFHIVSPDGKKELGRYAIKGVSKEDDRKFVITEMLSMEYRGRKAEYKSTVVYKASPSITPEKGTAETKINGMTCMKGTVTFLEETINIECTGFLNKRTGKAIDPPKKFEKKDEPRPDGILIFQSALPVIGPKLLPKEGELEDVVFVEFPDDLGAPELINFKKGYRLVREKPDEKGEYSLKLFSPHLKRSLFQARYDKEDQIVAIPSLGKIKLREVKKKNQ